MTGKTQAEHKTETQTGADGGPAGAGTGNQHRRGTDAGNSRLDSSKRKGSR